MSLTLPITEASYRFVETPIRQGRLGEWLRGDRRPRTAAAYKRRHRFATFGVVSAALVGFAGVSIAMADNRCVGQIECDSEAGRAIDPTLPPDESIEQPSTTLLSPGPTVALAPNQTVPPSTAPPTTVLQDIPLFAVGESVMLGAKSQLEAEGFFVDAAESRQGKEVVDVVARLRSSGRLGNTVVIHISTNGEVSDETFAAIMASLPPDEVKTVWFLTVRADRAWIDANNSRIISLPCKYPNVWVGYWSDFVPNIEGMASDGIHFKTNAAKQTYVDLIKGWTSSEQTDQCP